MQHPYLAQEGLIATPFIPTPEDLRPILLPPQENPVPARYITPHHHVQPILPAAPTAEAAIEAQVPTPGEVFDACRRWGTVRLVSVWLETGQLTDGLPVKWKCRVEFWYEDEAKRFEVGMGKMGILIKGWQV